MFGRSGITHTCLDPYPSLQVPPPELPPSLPAHSLTSSTWHLRLGVAGSCLSSRHNPVRGKLTFWRCCRGPSASGLCLSVPSAGHAPCYAGAWPLPQHGVRSPGSLFRAPPAGSRPSPLPQSLSALSVCAPTVPVPVI